MDENKSTGMEECEIRHKHRSAKEEKDLISRLNRIEGQVRGVKAMVQDERYCTDILVQVSAIQSALNGFSRTLLSSHVKSCVWRRSKTGMRIRPWTSCARPSGKCCKKELPVMVPPCKDPPAFLYHAGIWKMHGGTVTIV